MRRCLFIVLSLLSLKLAAQDTLVFKNDNKMAGEVKSLTNAVLKIETPYSDVDFAVDWLQVKKITTGTMFIIITSNLERATGRLRTDPSNPGDVIIALNEGGTKTVHQTDIVTLKSVSEQAKDRLSLLIDGGYSITKANDVRQLTFRAIGGYDADRYSVDVNYNTLSSSTLDSIKTYRSNYGFQFKYYVRKSTFLFSAFDWLESDEQDLELRTNIILGLGNSLIRNNKMDVSVSIGASLNSEDFQTEGAASRTSSEGYAKLEANLFGYDDLSLYTKLETYPSFTEKGRVRLNYDFNIRYDLPLDLYFSVNYQLNFDNQPQEGFSKSDYVFTTSVGWEF